MPGRIKLYLCFNLNLRCFSDEGPGADFYNMNMSWIIFQPPTTFHLDRKNRINKHLALCANMELKKLEREEKSRWTEGKQMAVAAVWPVWSDDSAKIACMISLKWLIRWTETARDYIFGGLYQTTGHQHTLNTHTQTYLTHQPFSGRFTGLCFWFV